MRGYHRSVRDLQSHVTPSRTREQIAELVKAGFPSPVEYAVQGGPLPVNLRRQQDDVDEQA